MAKDTEQDLVLAPRFYWRLFLQPKLKELLVRKYPHRKLESDDTSVIVSATRQKGLTRRFDRTDVDWCSIEKQLFDWGDLFLAGKTEVFYLLTRPVQVIRNHRIDVYSRKQRTLNVSISKG